ncbi:Abi family protein [Cellulomonas phragmiteti]|uniref:Abi-like protein n=1 Tax=Cellulomonas phragmiteti TaxID=478780 RepID=A0ABQ4DQC1_9CELL|nr:Abi family protein [Cellulomonas phragmiteti]GIG41182.1 hypothetical protein Cph01nite_29440 [Cellulomonas phragmiteti]
MSTPTWVHDWLTPGRFAKYLNAAGGDPRLGLELYEWNSEIASAFLRDLGHLEVAVRNAYDRALLTHPDLLHGEWLTAASCDRIFPPHMANDTNGQRQDKNATPRSNVKNARRLSGFDHGVVPRGKAVAELMFGFWSYLTDDLHEKSLWVPALHTAYVPGADRRRLHVALSALREFRNRVAHHESVFDRQPENHRRHIVFVARHLSPDLHQHLTQHSRLPAVIAARPVAGA